jgi:hypothetical protein
MMISAGFCTIKDAPRDRLVAGRPADATSTTLLLSAAQDRQTTRHTALRTRVRERAHTHAHTTQTAVGVAGVTGQAQGKPSGSSGSGSGRNRTLHFFLFDNNQNR